MNPFCTNCTNACQVLTSGLLSFPDTLISVATFCVDEFLTTLAAAPTASS